MVHAHINASGERVFFLLWSVSIYHVVWFALVQTLPMLRRVLDVVTAIASNDGIIVFVDPRPKNESLLRNVASLTNEYYISRRFMKVNLSELSTRSEH